MFNKKVKKLNSMQQGVKQTSCDIHMCQRIFFNKSINDQSVINLKYCECF